MSRVEENAKLRLPSSFHTDKEIQIAQAKFLEDISRSLAVIADNVEYLSIDIGGEIAFKNKEKTNGNGN